MSKQLEGFARYEAYKDSDVVWIGEIPINWDVKSVKSIFQERKEKNDPIKTRNILSLCMYRGVIPYAEKGAAGNKAKEDLTAYRLAYPNDIVMNSMNVVAGSVGLSKYFGAVSPVYYMLRPRNKHDLVEYYNAIFRNEAFQKSLVGLGNGILVKKSESTGKLNTIRMRIPMSKMNRVEMPYPSSEEQTAIANFLDQKTSQIDQAIAIKQQQITLLKERKQILIQNAVTRGLNPDAPMRDSGVEWIGEIPEHWQVKRLKYVLDERNERSETGKEPLFMVSQIHGLVVRSDYHSKAEVASSNVDNKTVYTNDLVFNKLKAHLGVFFKSNIDFKGIVSPDYAVYKSYAYIGDLKYLELLFRHPSYIAQFIIRATGIVEGLIRLYTDELFDISIGIPPEKEQYKILEYISLQSGKFTNAINLQQQQIQKLKEYKTTLINSAVTGKIKVA